MKKPGFISFERDRKPTVVPPVQEGQEGIVFFEFRPGNKYVAPDGSWFKIQKDAQNVPSGRFDVVMHDSVEGVTSSGERKSQDDLETLVKEKGYVLQPGAASVDRSAGGESPAVSADRSATGQVVELASARERRQEREKTDNPIAEAQASDTAPVDETAPVAQAAARGKKTAGAATKGAGKAALKERGKTAAEKVAKSGPGGPEGPESPGLDAVLAEFQTKFTSLIEAVKTPGEYAALRNGMTPADKGGKRYFLALKDIKHETKIEDLTSEQLTQIATIETTLEKAAREKFFEIKNAVLKDLSQRWRAELDGAPDATTLDALALKWSQEKVVPASWTEIFDSLSPKDQEFVTTDYAKRFAEFQVELQEKLAALAKTNQDAVRRQELEAILNIADPVKAREKVMFLEGLVIDRYHEYVKYMQHEAKKIKPNGVISAEECWSLWQTEGGEAALEDAVVKYLRVFHDVDAEAGKKAFLILVNSIKQGA